MYHAKMAQSTDMKYKARNILKFRRGYYRHGKHDLDKQASHLGKLADYYVARYNHLQPQHWTDCLKAHTLYNSAAARKPQLKCWKKKAFEIQKAYLGEWSDITYNQQTALTIKLSKELQSIRDNLREAMEPTSEKAEAFTMNQNYPADANMMSDFTACMQKNTTGCTDQMVRFAGLIIDESRKILSRRPPCPFSVVSLGSMAKAETTPYSDLEYLFLVDRKSPKIEEYFEHLAITSYFVIGNLKETNLKYMHITELQGWFEDRCKSGFKIDGLSPGAGNIPTGNGQHKQRNHFILTPAELVTRYTETLNNPIKEAAMRGDLTSMMTYMSTVYDHGDVGSSHMKLIRSSILGLVPDTRKEVNIEMLKSDVEKFNFTPDKKLHNKGFNVDVKKEFYRFPSILLLDISIVYECVSDSAWTTCDKLLSEGHISLDLHCSLKFMLACACYMRLSSYLYLDSDSFDDGISVAEKPVYADRHISEDSKYRKWFMPIGLFTILSQTLMCVRQGITTTLEMNAGIGLQLANLVISPEHSPWWFKFQVLYSAGRYGICRDVLKKERLVVPDQHGSKLIGEMADVYDFCNEPKKGIELLLSNAASNDNTNQVMLARCYTSSRQYEKALETLSAMNTSTAGSMFLQGQIYAEQGHLQEAELITVEALQLYIREVSVPCMYDYYGYPVPNDIITSDTNNFPDMLSDTPERRLRLIQIPSPDIIRCIRSLCNIYKELGAENLYHAYTKKADGLAKLVYGEDTFIPGRGIIKFSISLYRSSGKLRVELSQGDDLPTTGL